MTGTPSAGQVLTATSPTAADWPAIVTSRALPPNWAILDFWADNIDDVRWEVFEDSSHMPFVEETDAYIEVVDSFLASVDVSQEG